MGIFELIEPLPNLKTPHALAILRPWIDAGNAGTLALARLEAHYDARMAARKKEEMPSLSPDIENFLKEMEKRFRQG